MRIIQANVDPFKWIENFKANDPEDTVCNNNINRKPTKNIAKPQT